MNSFLKWFADSIPRAPKRPGLLMRVYYFWQEYFTSPGRAAAAFFPTAVLIGAVPNFWAAWIFCGLDFLMFIGMILSLFATARLTKISVEDVKVSPVFEGQTSKVSASVSIWKSTVDSVLLSCFRLDPSLKCEEMDYTTIPIKEGSKILECYIHTTRRGAFPLTNVSACVPEIMGLLRNPFDFKGSSELLVYPRPVKVGSFPFLMSGSSGNLFAPLLMPSFTRGMNFVGVREYREGDSLRDLHHKAFARYGRPFTKEFETERGAGAILVLDTVAPSMSHRACLEDAIRLAAGVGRWFIEQNILGRFFIDDEEITLQGLSDRDRMESLLEALSRIPPAKIVGGKTPGPWSPAARPMDPVLRIGLYPKEDFLVHKHVVVTSRKSPDFKAEHSDNTLIVDVEEIASALSKEKEVNL